VSLRTRGHGSRFASRYGPWGLVAGASEGLGAAFATALADWGLSLVLVARRPEPLERLAARLPTRSVTVVADLSTADGVAAACTAAAGLEVGLVVANAAYSPIGRFLDLTPRQTGRAVDLNCRAPLALAHHFLPEMAARGRGGFIVMSSLAGMQGSPPISVYAATKAFGAVLAEGLWAELRNSGVHILTCVAGAVATPGLTGAKPRRAPGTVTPEQVVNAALHRLGRGPRVVPGALMRVSSVLMSRVLPRRTAIGVISRASRDLTPPPGG
jgi:short-subunit dehydrogenase